jgi:hypothetical protein
MPGPPATPDTLTTALYQWLAVPGDPDIPLAAELTLADPTVDRLPPTRRPAPSHHHRS